MRLETSHGHPSHGVGKTYVQLPTQYFAQSRKILRPLPRQTLGGKPARRRFSGGGNWGVGGRTSGPACRMPSRRPFCGPPRDCRLARRGGTLRAVRVFLPSAPNFTCRDSVLRDALPYVSFTCIACDSVSMCVGMILLHPMNHIFIQGLEVNQGGRSSTTFSRWSSCQPTCLCLCLDTYSNIVKVHSYMINIHMRDGTGRDGTGRDGTGRDGTGRDGTGRDGTGRDGTGRDGTGRDGTGWDGVDR